MPFKKILQGLVERAGATGAVILDREGEILDKFSEDAHLDLDLIGAHYGVILGIVKDAAGRQGDLNDIGSVSILTERTRLSICVIKDGYYLVVTSGRKTPTGKTLLESSKAVKMIEAEIG